MPPSWRNPSSLLDRLTPVQCRAMTAITCLAILTWDFYSELPVGLLYIPMVGLAFWSADRWMPLATGFVSALFIMVGLASPLGPTPFQLALLIRLGGATIFIGSGWLITRHRALLAEAREREVVLRTIFDSEPACVKLLGPGCVLLDMNRAGLEFMEADSIEAVRGRSLLPLIMEEHREAFSQMAERVFAGERVSLQFECHGSHGRRRWMDSRSAPLRDPAGQVTAILSVTNDITHQKRAEALLRDNEHRLTQAADIAGLGFFEHDHITDTVYLSEGARRIFGIGPAEPWTVARAVALTHPDDRELTRAAMARAHDPTGDGLMRLDHRIIRPDGALTFTSIKSHTSFGDLGHGRVPVKTVGTLLDVTDQKRAEVQVRLSEQRLALATEMAGLGFFAHDYRADTIYWSEGARAMFGMPPSETWSSTDLLRAVHPEDRDHVDMAINRLRDPAHGTLALDYRVVRPSGEVRHLRVKGHMHFEELGRQPKQSIATLWDITERKQAESQRDALALRVLEVQEDERRAVARDLHDEIGQALSALKLNLLRLRRQRAGAGPIVTDSLRIADEVLQQVRDLALSLRPSILDDLGLGDAVQWYAEQTAARANLALSCEVEARVMGLSPATEIACFRVLQEALTNVHRHAQATNVLVQLRDDGATLQLVVRDDGRGFDVDRVIANAGRGSSMGLLGIRERAALLGGFTTVTSAPGVGCEVRVHLPRVAHDRSSAEAIALG